MQGGISRLESINMIRLLSFIVLMFLSAVLRAQTTYVVCVGLNVNRDRIEPLPCSRADAKGIANFFYNYNGSNVFMLLDSNATRSHILKVLRQQFAKSTPADEIIFAYSGHGFDGGLSTYNNEEVLYCSEVQRIMLNSKARRKMMFIMACHSGSFTKKYGKTDDKRRRYDKQSTVLLFLSSKANESSWETNAMENSFFYHYLLEALEGKADKNKDRKVTARELYNYVAPRVTRITARRQHPVMWGKFPDDMVIVNVQ